MSVAYMDQPRINPNRVADAFRLQPPEAKQVPDFIQRSAMTAVFLRALILSGPEDNLGYLKFIGDNLHQMFWDQERTWEGMVNSGAYSLSPFDALQADQTMFYYRSVRYFGNYWGDWGAALDGDSVLSRQIHGLIEPLCSSLVMRIGELLKKGFNRKNYLGKLLSSNPFDGVLVIKHDQDIPYRPNGH